MKVTDKFDMNIRI